MKSKDLTESELDRYSRQISLDYIGYDGQIRLKNGRVCIVGVGGLGSPATLKLAAMGIGYVRIIDRDVVSRSDLHRQSLYDESSVGMPKVEAAQRKLKALNQELKVDALATSLKASNAEELLEGVDVIIDGLDSIETRYVVNRTALSLKIPYVYAGAVETYGNISTIIPNETACLECFFPKAKDEEMPRCAIVGVFPPVVDIVSNIEVSEAIRILLDKEPCLKNRLLFVDIGQLAFNTVDIVKNPNCLICGKGEQKASDHEEKIVNGLCGRDGRGIFMINVKTHPLDITKIQSHVKTKGFLITMHTKLGLTFEYSDKVKISLLEGGVVIIQVAPKSGIYDGQTALQLYGRLTDDLDLPKI